MKNSEANYFSKYTVLIFCVSKEGFKFYKLFKPHLIGYGLRSNFYFIKRSPLLLILDVIIRSQK